jgi:hypothetical protein
MSVPASSWFSLSRRMGLSRYLVVSLVCSTSFTHRLDIFLTICVLVPLECSCSLHYRPINTCQLAGCLCQSLYQHCSGPGMIFLALQWLSDCRLLQISAVQLGAPLPIASTSLPLHILRHTAANKTRWLLLLLHLRCSNLAYQRPALHMHVLTLLLSDEHAALTVCLNAVTCRVNEALPNCLQRRPCPSANWHSSDNRMPEQPRQLVHTHLQMSKG